MEVLSSPYWGSAQTLNSTQLSALLKKKDKPKSLVLKKLLKYVILLNIKKKMKTIDKDYPVIFYFLFLFFSPQGYLTCFFDFAWKYVCLHRYFCAILCMSICPLSCLNSVGYASASAVTIFSFSLQKSFVSCN